MIVPLSFGSAKKMESIRRLFLQNTLYISSYEIRPAKLFDGSKGAEQRLNIFISHCSTNSIVKSTKVLRWNSEHRNILFPCLYYVNTINKERFWRFSSSIEQDIIKKYSSNKSVSLETTSITNGCGVHYRSAGLRYWIIFLCNGFDTNSLSNKIKLFDSANKAKFYMAGVNSSLYWWYYALNFDMFNQTDSNISEFKLTFSSKLKLQVLSDMLEKDLNKNKRNLITNKSDGSFNSSFAYDKKKSKSIIDEIDKVLAVHYGFTDEELDFIINYDIKYRMGDELGNE